MMHAWQKQSKYQPQFLLNFQNWFLKVLYIQQIKNQTLSADFPILQTYCIYSSIPCDYQVSYADDLFWFRQHAPCYCGKIFCKTAWYIQMPYMDTIRAVHYVLSVPYVSARYVSFTPSQLYSNFHFHQITSFSTTNHTCGWRRHVLFLYICIR